jgi:tetratricopeptide (TPR) repeat protein
MPPRAATRIAMRRSPIAKALDLRRPEEDTPGYAALCERLARTQLLNGALDDACAWGRRALDLYLTQDDRAAAGPLAIWLARRLTDAGRPIEEAVALVEAVLQRAGPRDGDVRYSALTALAYLSLHRGRAAEAREHFALAEQMLGSHSLGSHSLEDRHLFHDVRAEVRAHDRNLAGALEDNRAAVDVARRIGVAERLSITLCNYGRFAVFAGDNAMAIDAYREAVELSERANLSRASALVKRSLAFTYLLTGDLTNAEVTSDNADVIATICGLEGSERSAVIVNRNNAAAWHLAAGDVPAAREAALEAIDLAQRRWGGVAVLTHLSIAAVGALLGDVHRAARLKGYIDRHYAETGDIMEGPDQRTFDTMTAALREQLTNGELGARAAEGAALDEDAAAELAHSIARTLRTTDG